MTDVSRLFQKASSLHQKGRLAEAEKLYKKILVQAPGYTPVFNTLGILSAQKGDLRAAIDYFNKAITAAPGDLAARENLARAWLTAGQYGEAQAAYDQALKINPASYASLFGLGCALQYQMRYVEALEVFARAQAINPGDPTLYLNLGLACQHLARLEEAARYFRQSLQLAPGSIDANVCLAHLYLQQEDYGSAENYFLQAKALGAVRADVECGYAQVLEHKGDFALAGQHFFKAVELDPASQNAYIQLDQYLLKSGGQKKQAMLDELASDHVYKDWRESLGDMRRLAAMTDYPDEGALRALHAFIDDYEPGELHDRSWWQMRIDSFGGVNNGHDKLMRSLHSAVYCWSLPDKQTLTGIAEFVTGTRLCSYGAGSGVWEGLLQDHFGIDVVASDINLRHRFLPMTRQDYSDAEVMPGDSIFFAWIVRGDLRVLNIFNRMRPGQKLVLVGEPPDREGIPRICGTAQMWSLLASEFSLVKTIPLVSYSLLNDTASLYVKK